VRDELGIGHGIDAAFSHVHEHVGDRRDRAPALKRANPAASFGSPQRCHKRVRRRQAVSENAFTRVVFRGTSSNSSCCTSIGGQKHLHDKPILRGLDIETKDRKEEIAMRDLNN